MLFHSLATFRRFCAFLPTLSLNKASCLFLPRLGGNGKALIAYETFFSFVSLSFLRS